MTAIDLAGSPIVITLLFALMFKALQERYITWRNAWIGAIATAALFTIGKWAIGIYLGGAAMASMYGAASSLMTILIWVYYSALMFFLGAEFTYVYAHEYGSRPGSPLRPHGRCASSKGRPSTCFTNSFLPT
jgi:membrane protein